MPVRAFRAREETGGPWALTHQVAVGTELLEVHLLAPLRTELMPGLFVATPIRSVGLRVMVDFTLQPYYSHYAARMDRFDWDMDAAALTLRFKIAGPAVLDALAAHLHGFARLRSVSDTEVELQFAALRTTGDFENAVPALRLACTTAFVHPWLLRRLYQRLTPHANIDSGRDPIRDPRTGHADYDHLIITRRVSPWHTQRVDLHYYYRTPGEEAGNPPSVVLLGQDRRVSHPLLLAADVEPICDDVCAYLSPRWGAPSG